MAEKGHGIKVGVDGGGGVPPKNGFFLVGNGGVSEFKGVSRANVRGIPRKCVWEKENESRWWKVGERLVKGKEKKGEINQNPLSIWITNLLLPLIARTLKQN